MIRGEDVAFGVWALNGEGWFKGKVVMVEEDEEEEEEGRASGGCAVSLGSSSEEGVVRVDKGADEDDTGMECGLLKRGSGKSKF